MHSHVAVSEKMCENGGNIKVPAGRHLGAALDGQLKSGYYHAMSRGPRQTDSIERPHR
jgi:hypothetical protein